MSFLQKFIVLRPYLGESIIKGSTVHATIIISPHAYQETHTLGDRKISENQPYGMQVIPTSTIPMHVYRLTWPDMKPAGISRYISTQHTVAM